MMKNIEQKVLANLHKLTPEKQLIVLYVVESLVYPTTQPRSPDNNTVETAWQRSLARMKRGYHLGGKMPTRESLHER
ncbi:MAG: hypothetical protein ABFS56_28225 [Pseudomonadota bacterium]